jgi:hypothetical protein
VSHIAAGLGAIRVDRLDRNDVARWLMGIDHHGRSCGHDGSEPLAGQHFR